MANINEEKEILTKKLSEEYSQNIITLEEYERILDYINKTETIKEIAIIDKIITENKNKENNELTLFENNKKEKHLALFSWRSSTVKPNNGNAGKYYSIFGANRIIIDHLPKEKTILNVNSILGLTEIIISKYIRVINKTIPVLARIFMSNETADKQTEDEKPELYIMGKAILGNITIIRK